MPRNSGDTGAAQRCSARVNRTGASPTQPTSTAIPGPQYARHTQSEHWGGQSSPSSAGQSSSSQSAQQSLCPTTAAAAGAMPAIAPLRSSTSAI